MRRRVLFFCGALAVNVLMALYAGHEAMATGNDVALNLGELLRKSAGEIYGGVVALFALPFLFTRRFTELGLYFVAAIVVGWLVFSPDQVAEAARAIAGRCSVSADRRTIRSYQRVFRPDRRLHSIEGRALPVPGGVPLRGLGYAGAALGAVLVLGTGSILVYLALAACAATAGAALGGRDGAALAGAVGLGGAWILGHLLGALDWPIRLVLIPAAVAMVGTQATPDGRPAHRFAAAWLALRLSPRRRSLGRALPAEDTPRIEECELRVSADEHSPTLRRSRIGGEGEIGFAAEVSARRPRLRQRRIEVRPATGRERTGELITTRLAVTAGETVEVRP